MTWSSLRADTLVATPKSTLCDLSFGFPGIDWPFLQSVYGWSAFQYQAWARGKLTVEDETEQKVVLYTDHVIEFWVDDRPTFGGDFYAFRNAPLILHLSPGEHKIGRCSRYTISLIY